MTKQRSPFYSNELEDKVRAMSRDDLWRLCHGKICETPDCNNACYGVTVLCVECLHGVATSASPIYQIAKRLLKKKDSSP